MIHTQMHSGAEPGVRLVQPPKGPAALERVRGHARLAVALRDGRFRPMTVYQSGSAKIRLPRDRAGAPFEGVLLNTAGGVTGGDRLSYEVSVGEAAEAVVTTPAAERVYRRSEGVARIDTTLAVAPGGRLDWLPQETILFDSSALSRRLTADIAADATLLAVEPLVLGRTAMGETIRTVFARDVWRIRRDGVLVFADALRLDGDSEMIMKGDATGAGARAMATLVLVAPDAEARLDTVRAALENARGEAGASAWNGMLVARFLAPGGQALRADLMMLIETLRGAPMPRVWHC